jgi:hypothetical protein
VTTLLIVGALGVLAGLYEQLRLSKTRRKRADRPRHTNEDELAPAWYAAFERSRQGQSFGPGRPVSRFVIVMLIAVGGTVVLFCAAAILTASVITLMGQSASSRLDAFSYPQLVSMARTAAGGRSYRSPPNGSTTPVEAGDALLAISSTAVRRKPSSLERPVSNDYPPWRRVLPSQVLFPATRAVSWTTAAVLAAGNGLTAQQRDLLTRASAHPAQEEFSRAAAAAAADPYGALLALPFKERVNLFTFPSLSLYALIGAAESHAALTALDVADHRPLDAERHAREIISVGSLVLDMHQAQDVNIGLQILERGVRTLEAVYVATGRDHEARVLLDSVAAASSRANQKQLMPARQALRYAMRDTTLLRGARMEMLLPLVLRVCADPKQLLFGTDDRYRRDMAFARDSLARFPSERAWIAALDEMLNLDAASWGDIEHSTALMTLARTIDGVVGGKRFESCAGLSSFASAMMM